jgi:hypothetical protein
MTDWKFIEGLSEEYGIPMNILVELASFVRYWVDATPVPGSPHRTKNKDFDRIIHASVEAIHIETSEGVIHLNKRDPLFQYFNIGIRRVQGNFNKELNKADKQWQKKLNDMAEKTIFNVIDSYYKDKQKTAVERDSVIGECLRHFGVNARTPIQTRDEWVENIKSADTYHDYLHNIVKSRRKKFRKK